MDHAVLKSLDPVSGMICHRLCMYHPAHSDSFRADKDNTVLVRLRDMIWRFHDCLGRWVANCVQTVNILQHSQFCRCHCKWLILQGGANIRKCPFSWKTWWLWKCISDWYIADISEECEWCSCCHCCFIANWRYLIAVSGCVWWATACLTWRVYYRT